MPENLFEKFNQIREEQEQARTQSALDKQEILEAIAHLGKNQKPTIQPQVTRETPEIVLHNFLKRSAKEYHFFGFLEDFEKSKVVTLLSLFVSLLVGIITNILTTKGCGLLSTFTLIEDIWLFLVIRMICHTIHSQRYYDHVDYSCHSFERFVINADGLYCPNGTKKSYKIVRVLAVISAVCNMIFLCMRPNGAKTVWAVIFEILFLVSVFFAMYMMVNHFCMYSFVYYSGKNDAGTQRITIVHDMSGNQLYTQEDFEKKFPFAR